MNAPRGILLALALPLFVVVCARDLGAADLRHAAWPAAPVGLDAVPDSPDLAAGNWLEASIAGRWPDWLGDIPAVPAVDPALEAVYSGDLNLPSAASGPAGGALPDGIPFDGDQSNKVITVMALALAIGALRLYLKSAAFRKFLFETFSPLSPLGY